MHAIHKSHLKAFYESYPKFEPGDKLLGKRVIPELLDIFCCLSGKNRKEFLFDKT